MDEVSIKVFLDPTINSTFRTTLMSYLREASNSIENEYMFAKISEEVNERAMMPKTIQAATMAAKSNVFFFIILSFTNG